MASSGMFSYQKLRENQTEVVDEIESDVVFSRKARGWLKLRRSSGSKRSRRWWRRKPRLRIPGLRRVVRKRTKSLKLAVKKVVERFKEGRSHLGDLFAGNYMLMQINPSSPTSMKYLDKSFTGEPKLPPPPSKYYLPYVE